MEREMESRTPSIIDLNAELAKLTMFRGLTPQTKRAERRGSGTQLGSYRDGILIAGKSAGTSHWETHPGDHIELDVNDPRTVEPKKVIGSETPSIIDLNPELPKLTIFRGRTPQSTMADRKGSAARLASYRDGALTATKFARNGHWGS